MDRHFIIYYAGSMKTERNPLGFMGTGGIFQRDGWWYCQYRDPETKKNVQQKCGEHREDALRMLAYTMIELYERRLDDLYETVTKLDPTPCNELILTRRFRLRFGEKQYRERFGEPAGPLDRLCSLPSGRKTTSVRRAASDERARGGTVSAPQRTLDTPGDGGGKARVRKGGEQPAAVRPRGSRPVRGTAQREGLK
jgi:hypothetical protein